MIIERKTDRQMRIYVDELKEPTSGRFNNTYHRVLASITFTISWSLDGQAYIIVGQLPHRPITVHRMSNVRESLNINYDSDGFSK